MITITLTTDFGMSDGYVGVMKGVIRNICPEAEVIDLSHYIEPQNIRQAAFLLGNCYSYFPIGTVHVVVVDPGVGSERRAIAAQTETAFFVLPDNGLLSFVAGREPIERVIVLNNPSFWIHPVSNTFHGRDIFAPVAAHLASGVPITDLGDPIDPDEIVLFPVPKPILSSKGEIIGRVIHIDHFGNLITNICARWCDNGEVEFTIGENRISCAPERVKVFGIGIEICGLSRSYSQAISGGVIALISSSGYVEIALPGGDARRHLRAKIDDEITLRFRLT